MGLRLQIPLVNLPAAVISFANDHKSFPIVFFFQPDDISFPYLLRSFFAGQARSSHGVKKILNGRCSVPLAPRVIFFFSSPWSSDNKNQQPFFVSLHPAPSAFTVIAVNTLLDLP